MRTHSTEGVLELLGDALHPAEANGGESGGDRVVVEGGANLALFLRRFGDPLRGIRDVAEEPSVVLRHGTEKIKTDMNGYNGYGMR